MSNQVTITMSSGAAQKLARGFVELDVREDARKAVIEQERDERRAKLNLPWTVGSGVHHPQGPDYGIEANGVRWPVSFEQAKLRAAAPELAAELEDTQRLLECWINANPPGLHSMEELSDSVKSIEAKLRKSGWR